MEAEVFCRDIESISAKEHSVPVRQHKQTRAKVIHIIQNARAVTRDDLARMQLDYYLNLLCNLEIEYEIDRFPAYQEGLKSKELRAHYRSRERGAVSPGNWSFL